VVEPTQNFVANDSTICLKHMSKNENMIFIFIYIVVILKRITSVKMEM
jgi:hypothetical protein